MIRLGSDKNLSGTTIARFKKKDPQRQFPKKIYQEGKYGIPVVQPSRAESMVMVIMVAMDIMIVGHHDRHRCHGHDHHFIADSFKLDTALLSYCPCVRSCVTGVTFHISHIYKGISAMLIIRDPSTPIYSESKSSWLSF